MKELKEIITDETLLFDRADEVDTKTEMKEAREIISQLKAIIRANNLTSLSAPAIGYGKRIFCINFSDSEIKTFINPIIASGEGAVLSEETSPCLPGRRFVIPRNNKISVMYTRPTGQVESREISGAASAVFQQEIEMLEGVLVSNMGLEIDELWDKASQEEREEVINAYLDSLDYREQEINKEIQEDPDLKQISDAIDFVSKARIGEIETMKIELPSDE